MAVQVFTLIAYLVAERFLEMTPAAVRPSAGAHDQADGWVFQLVVVPMDLFSPVGSGRLRLDVGVGAWEYGDGMRRLPSLADVTAGALGASAHGALGRSAFAVRRTSRHTSAPGDGADGKGKGCSPQNGPA